MPSLSLKHLRRIGIVGVIAVAFVGGYFIRGFVANKNKPAPGHTHASAGSKKKAEIWTCSMHPQIRKPKPGKCPICGMDLVRADAGDGSAHPRELKMSAHARKLAEIAVTPVVRKAMKAEVRVVGKVTYDETRTGYITSWVKGRVQRLFVNYTGVRVKRWQPMVYVYSPELVSAQMELIQAAKLTQQLARTSVPGFGGSGSPMLQAARHKLRLLGLSPGQIRRIEKQGKSVDHLVIYAPVSGVVTEKLAQEQMYVQPGTRLYTISDLSRVWVKLDLYESEIAWIKVGQEVSFQVESYAGETFTGKVAFIDPFVTGRTRTIKVRLEVANADRRLKPDMFVRAVLRSQVDRRGRAVAAGQPGEPPLVIPASAPLFTGKRAIVYVERTPGTYRGREVTLGPRVGEHYVVLAGLRVGEKVVTHGNFKIDSALQIQAKKSMMNPAGGGAAPGHRHGDPRSEPGEAGSIPLPRFETPAKFRAQLDGVVKAYFAVQLHLSKDDLAAAKRAAADVTAALGKVDMRLVKGAAHLGWMKHKKALEAPAQLIAGSTDLQTARAHFEPLSRSVIVTVRRFGLSGKVPVYLFHCTMAFNNKGASWLQPKKGVKNPYYGSKMYQCGDEKETLVSGAPP